MKAHMLLIGFSCTGKTSLGKRAFGEGTILDSDDELLKCIGKKENRPFAHVYEIYMKLGRDRALALIQRAEEALIDKWAGDNKRKIISLGPGFPLRENWPRLRQVSYVVLFTKSPERIYEYMKKRRGEIFARCPEAREHDNWDIGVMVDGQGKDFSREEAIHKIRTLLHERNPFYRKNDAELDTNDEEHAIRRLKELWDLLRRG